MSKKRGKIERLWDLWCLLSGIGIWPRYIEPHLLSVSRLTLLIPSLAPALENMTILHLSDLHWGLSFSPLLRSQIIKQTTLIKPDLICFTGDFLCRSQLEDKEGLKTFLNSLKAKIGCFAILGNHDYAQFVTINEEGDYDVDIPSPEAVVAKGIKALFRSVPLTQRITLEAKKVKMHADLIALLKETPFQLLHNETQFVSFQDSGINLCGLGEYTLGQFHPEKAFSSYQSAFPGIILSHHPDTLPLLKAYPGELILSGHTHGGQVNLPFLWKRFTRLAHPEFKRGLKRLGEKKWAYINRGLSGLIPFRWFSLPELTLLTLKREKSR